MVQPFVWSTCTLPFKSTEYILEHSHGLFQACTFAVVLMVFGIFVDRIYQLFFVRVLREYSVVRLGLSKQEIHRDQSNLYHRQFHPNVLLLPHVDRESVPGVHPSRR